jgi:hypothetical protein
MKSIIVDQTGVPKSDNFGANSGGYNLLNVDTPLVGLEFWDSYNKPFLDAAVSRGDPIYLATVPQVKTDIIKNGVPTGMYGKEMEYLVQHNVKPKNITDAKWQEIKGWFKND